MLKKIFVVAGMIGLVSCATPPQKTEVDTLADAVSRTCGGGATYANSANFKLAIKELIKSGEGSGSVNLNSELTAAFLRVDGINATNVGPLMTGYQKCIPPTLALLRNQGGATTVIGSGGKVGNVNTISTTGN